MNNKPLIFTIIRGSFVDGYGVRTTVFLKGCPLRCRWCCNPESQKAEQELKITVEDCTHCGFCYEFCEALSLTENGPVIDKTKCDCCGRCVEVCPTNAIDFFAKEYSIDELVDELMLDKPYYDRSNGGVTIGGGEATMHYDYTYELMKKLQANGINVAIDTCGYTVSEKSLKVLEEADLLLFDIKGLNKEKHIAATHADNTRIKENLIHLSNLNKEIIIRIPLIPGYTDDDDTIQEEVEFISNLKSVKRIDILPYHDFGRIKYRQLGREYIMDSAETQSDERIEEIKKMFEKTGVAVQIGG